MVTRPAVPPYSSLTIAMCVRLAWKSRSWTSIGFEIGMNDARPHERLPAVHRLVVVDDEGQQILGVQDARDVVERLLEHGEARVLGAAHAIHHLAPARRQLDPDDVHARHHHLAHHRIGEREHAVQQRLLIARHVRLRRDDLPELLGGLLALLCALFHRGRRQEALEQQIERHARAQHGREDHLQHLDQRRECHGEARRRGESERAADAFDDHHDDERDTPA